MCPTEIRQIKDLYWDSEMVDISGGRTKKTMTEGTKNIIKINQQAWQYCGNTVNVRRIVLPVSS